MRQGILRPLSGLLGGIAFAVSVAGPVQWDPCPEHGVGVRTAAATMEMPAGHEMPAAAVHGGERSGAHHAGHQCTCPGGCCSSNSTGLAAGSIESGIARLAVVSARIAIPSDAVDLASSPQLALPFANAPPVFRVTTRHAAALT